MRYYILDKKRVVRVDRTTAMNWNIENSEKHNVFLTKIYPNREVFTMFSIKDHALNAQVFQTIVFGGILDGNFERASSYKRAEIEHITMVRRVRSIIDQNGIKR